MEEKFFKTGSLFCFLTSVILTLLLTSCAASSVTRSAASRVDYTVDRADTTGLTDNDPQLAYENYSQTAKGAVIGSATGAIAGALTTGTIGILPGAAGGAVIGGIFGSWIDRHATLRDQLENRGVKVLVLGDQLLIVIPGVQLFNGMTPQLIPQARSTLDLVGDLIRGLTTISVRVSGFTNATGSPQMNCVVSQQQADTVVKYLFPIVNTRVITGTGYGGTHLIARNNTRWDGGANYRIEISLEKLPS